MHVSAKPVLTSIGHLLAVTAVYWHLISGGWLTTEYHLNDPNIVNLALAIFEPIALLTVVLYWILRTRFWGRLLSIFFLIQILIGTVSLLFLFLFAITWHPKIM